MMLNRDSVTIPTSLSVRHQERQISINTAIYCGVDRDLQFETVFNSFPNGQKTVKTVFKSLCQCNTAMNRGVNG